MTEAHAIARQAAQQLASRYGKDLPMAVEKAILGGEQPGKFVSVGDMASIAGVILAAAALAWQIWRDTRASGKAPEPETVRRTLRLELKLPQGLGTEARDEIIVTVVEEVVKGG